jgi:hypothetical protein
LSPTETGTIDVATNLQAACAEFGWSQTRLLQPGDSIIVTTVNGSYTYRVHRSASFPYTDGAMLDQSQGIQGSGRPGSS